MQEKIQKLFSFFGNIKNEPFYTSCISQIVDVYENCPESLKFILYNLKQLIFSETKEVRLRLKHRQISASIISKLNAKYVLRVKSFTHQLELFQLESFQLQSTDNDRTQPNSHQQSWHQLDFIQVIDHNTPLYSSSRYMHQKQQHQQQQEQNNFFEQFHQIKQATMINMEELLGELNQDDREDTQPLVGGTKYQAKINKLREKNQQHQNYSELIISNPFNLIYEICVDNILSPQWELRHFSVLILKELILNPDLLGFSERVTFPKLQSRQARFQYLSVETRRLLIEHLKNSKYKQKMFNQINKNCMILLCLDRFADYQSDESNIIVRAQGAQVLRICFDYFEQPQKIKMLKIIKKLFDHPIANSTDKTNKKGSIYSWQVKHSFVYLLSLILQKKSNIELVFKYLQQSLIKLISCQQFDEIIVYVCRCLGRFVGQQFLKEKVMVRINEQLWNIVERLDDISISTRQTLSLLAKMFSTFKLNQNACLEKIKKYYTSKIPQVRHQLYSLSTMLYSRNFKPDPQTIDKNLMQFLQAIYVENQQALITQLQQMGHPIYTYVIKTDKVGRMAYFLTHILLRHQTANSIISKYFKVYEGASMLQNDYIYINEQERLNISLDIYINKRIFKFARVLSHTFQNTLEGLSQLIKKMEEQKAFNHRGTLLFLSIIAFILLQNQKINFKHPFFQQQKQKAQNILTLEYHQISDFHIQALRQQFKSRFQKYCQVDESLKQFGVAFKSKNWKENTAAQVRSILLDKYQKTPNNDLRLLLSLLDAVIEIQKSLLKYLKMVSLYIIMKLTYPEQPSSLTIIMSTIHNVIVDDQYYFMSLLVGKTLSMLTKSIFNDKKAKCIKITSDTIERVSKKYKKTQLDLKQNLQSIRFEGGFMEGFSIFIEDIGADIPEWIQLFSNYFLNQCNIILSNTRNPKLYLLSGVINSLLSLRSSKFLTDLLSQINSILSLNSSQHPQNFNLIYQIITKIFIYFCKYFNQQANIFFKWFLEKLQQNCYIAFLILQALGKQQIVVIAPICALFIMQTVRSISIPSIQDIVMGCLSNLIVGVYTNIQHLPLCKQLQVIYEEGIDFVKNFKDPGKFQYTLEIQLKKQIELRNYQLQGISWLGFLTKYNLNGALCDDMGLGKTLQILILIQNQYHKLIKNHSIESKLNSLIVVPTTIMEHWAFEHRKYFTKNNCKVFIIDNSKNFNYLSNENGSIIITNYNLLEKNIVQFEKYQFNFIILDQGHIIKNTDTNKFKAVKRLKGLHRFILTGTPIQNRLKELWGLFDFLMPGYLYTKELFKKNYQKLFEVNLTTFKEDQLMFSENQRKTLDKLHFKVMPFIMRRLKTDVLQELPNKIINDYYCSMTPTQMELYYQFQGKSFKGSKSDQSQFQEINVLKSLSYMKKILNHPALIGKKQLFQDSGKFIALSQLFEQLGLNQTDSLLQNKVIIFSRSNKTIQLIETLFMKSAFPDVKYLKLTGSVKPSNRFTIAQSFNGDADIKVLLVTTSVGGQGLNLCSANVVIMFDHDYNPTIDMQAIDRAHRIGQKRILNVYRLITKDTLEEKIMGIQKFKTNLANAIVNIDNASIKNIQESKLPDLLQNVRDLQDSQENKKKLATTFYQRMIQEIQENAINQNEFKKEY